MTDPIADMLTRIRNAQRVHTKNISLPFSKIKQKLAEIMQEEGYIENVQKEETLGYPELILTLKYSPEGEPVISDIQRVSKVGRRVYRRADNLPYVYNGLGIAIVSTSRGLMTNKKAYRQKLGGEIICEIF